MLRDVFYYGNKPNVHPREKYAESLVDARNQASTSHFWIINEFCNYKDFDWDFDFEFLPDEDVWAEDHNNIWPSQHQKDSGTWLCNTDNETPLTIYRADVNPVIRKNIKSDNWVELDRVDHSKFDFSWHPSPTDPPYIYKWGSKFAPVQLKTCLEYRTPGATQVKYMDQIVELLPNTEFWVEVQQVDKDKFDMSWRPNPLDPPFIYIWGNKYIDGKLRSTLEYHVPGATTKKFMPELLNVLPEWDKWEIIHPVHKDSFDFSWRPDPREPNMNYVFGHSQYDSTKMPTIIYKMEGATNEKHMPSNAKLLPQVSRFDHLEDSIGIDYSWVPDPTAPPYIYVWGNQWNKPEDKISIQYVVEGATEYQYMTNRATRKSCKDNWKVPEDIDVTMFDFSWEPSPADPPFIYEFGTQWQKTGGPRYVVEGATEVKYMSFQHARKLICTDNWTTPNNIDATNFDFSWHPDATSPPYIYVFPTQWALSGGPMYTVHNATEIKYVDDLVAKAIPDKTNWEIPSVINSESFDFSWHPYAEDEPYIYQFGTQWQKTGGPKYIAPGCHKNSQVKYIDTRILKAERLPSSDGFTILDDYKIYTFDYSWHPDETEEPYIYVFGNNQYPAEIMPTIEYVVSGATVVKYVPEVIATLAEDLNNWSIPQLIDVSDFDFTWKPNPKDPPFIYEFGTQWQKTGGPRYIVPGSTDTKFIDIQRAKALPTTSNWTLPTNIDVTNFDFSWHPDATSPPYIYYFATQWALSGGPIYTVPNATEIKYVEDQQVIALPNKEHWEYDSNLVDDSKFDFSWHPYAEDEPYIYQFGTQHQKTGGPRYITPGCHKNSQVKYIDTRILKASRLFNLDNWNIVDNLKIFAFDYSWHPDETEEPYIYVFGNNQYPAEIMPTIEYVVSGAKEIKYVNSIVATLDVDMSNWVIPEDIDVSEFDFKWKPNPKDPPYIYQFGTQWQKTGGPRYVVEGAIEVKYVDHFKSTALPTTTNWTIPENLDTSAFDFSWHPDDTSPPYVYYFATQWALTGGPIYTVKGAVESTYLSEPSAIALPSRENWEIPTDIEVDKFDFSWHPYAQDEPYIYQFGTQHQKTGGPKYVTPGSHKNSQVKYIDTRILKSVKKPNKKNFSTLNKYSITEFDYSWHPDETDEPYIYQFGNNQYSAEIMPTIEYIVPGATQIKYIKDVVAILGEDLENWIIPDSIDTSEFDYSWKPNPKDPPYIYQFGTQWQKTDGPCYIVEGATEVKYVTGSKAKKLPNKENWTLPTNIDVTNFDFSWHPDATSPPYVYVFSTQWALSGGPIYTVPGATEIKYVEDQSAKALPDRTNWEYDSTLIDDSTFDFSWHPYVEDQPYIYQFGTQWQKTGGPVYRTPGCHNTSPIKYVDVRILKATRLPDKNKFVTHKDFKIKEFDYSWHPDDTSPPYLYVFGNNLYPAEECSTVEYHVPKGTEVKFIKDIVATLDRNMTNWEIPAGVDVRRFNFSWIPHPTAPPYIYQFGTIQDPTDGPKYITPNNTGEIVKLPRIEVKEVVEEPVENAVVLVNKYYISTTLEALAAEHKSELFWALNPNIDYSDFDFEWRPNIEQAQYVHAFGSSSSEITQTYFINGNMWSKGHREINWVVDKKLDDETLYQMFKKPDMFFVDKGNPEAQQRFDSLKSKYPAIQKTRYLNSWADTVNRCCNRASSNLLWVLNSELDYTSFNFEYYPNPWQMKMVHVFGTQWSHWGTTFMVNRETFPNDTKYVKIIEHLTNLNFIKDIRSTATSCVQDIVLIDHGNNDLDKVRDLLQYKAGDKQVSIVKYENSYLNTLKNIVNKQPQKKDHYLWICSSICDYKDFDFSYVCDPFAKDQLHVFPSGKQKFGDTFLIDVNKTRDIIGDMSILEDYTKVNYNATMRVNRMPEPVIVTTDDTYVDVAKQITDFPYATISTEKDISLPIPDYEPMNLWAPETKNIIVLSTGASRIVVPSDISTHIKHELYDYPYIKKAPRLAISHPMDIVFLSNGEIGAEANWEHLQKITKGLKNRVVRVDGVNGRVAAYHAAAAASETPWMFTVFAKLKVSPKFDFNWQPDRMQIPKHYIFQAKNPVNGLVYGHQAMIAYNKKMTLANLGYGLDFTLDDPHQVVELLSGIAQYNTDPFSTWRTAFREVLKLRDEDSDISQERLDVWLNKAEGEFAQYSIKGAVDADEFYDEVKGNFKELRKSYEWAWLKERFDQL